jgi:serine protease Do
VDSRSISSLPALIECYKQVMEMDPLPEYLLISFERLGQNHLTLLKPKPEEDVDPPRELPKAWIGVATQPVLKDLAEKLGDATTLGFRITRVYPNTLAAESGLRVGDIIVGLNGEKLQPRGMQDAGLLQREVRRLEIDEQAKLTILREGQTSDVSVTLERTRLTPQEARRDRNRDFELTVREATFFDRDENRWPPEIRGVLVEQIEPAGWAGLGGLRPGDLVQRVGDTEVQDLEDYRKAISAVTEAKPERVVFVVLRGAKTHFQYIEPDWNPVSEDNADKEDES